MTELSELYAQLPLLRESTHQVTSPATDSYNCVAWVERDLDRWWEPGFYWPAPEPTDEADLDAYVELFSRVGFELCAAPLAEEGFLKIAIYAADGAFHHVAKQLPSGRWSSKAGRLHDFRHDRLDAVEGAPLLGQAVAAVYMRRPYDGHDRMEMEEDGLIRL